MLKKMFVLMVLGAGSLVMAKQQAPVKVEATVGSASTSLKLTFERAADLVDVQVWGTDGLVVNGSKDLVINGTFSAGQVAQFTVGHSSGPGHHNLVVSVHGHFDGATSSRIASFTVGDKTAPVKYKTARDSASGRQIIEMRGDRKQ